MTNPQNQLISKEFSENISDALHPEARSCRKSWFWRIFDTRTLKIFNLINFVFWVQKSRFFQKVTLFGALATPFNLLWHSWKLDYFFFTEDIHLKKILSSLPQRDMLHPEARSCWKSRFWRIFDDRTLKIFNLINIWILSRKIPIPPSTFSDTPENLTTSFSRRIYTSKK